MADSDIEFTFKPLSDVEAYRSIMLAKAGYSDHVAFDLALRKDIDLHVAQGAIRCGSELEALWLLGVIEDD